MPNLLEEYLNQLRLQLEGMPRQQREAEIEEARQHLESLIQQRIEAGDSEAIISALRQFGSPQANGKALRQVWNREGGTPNRFLVVVHFLLGVVLLHCVLTESLGRYYSHFFGHPHGPVWVLWPMLDHWTFGVYELPLYALFALSFLFPRQLRTIFFGVFTTFIASSIAVDTIEMHSFMPYNAGYVLYMRMGYGMDLVAGTALYLVYVWKVILLLLSSSATFMELTRDKSLFSKGRQNVRLS